MARDADGAFRYRAAESADRYGLQAVMRREGIRKEALWCRRIFENMREEGRRRGARRRRGVEEE